MRLETFVKNLGVKESSARYAMKQLQQKLRCMDARRVTNRV